MNDYFLGKRSLIVGDDQFWGTNSHFLRVNDHYFGLSDHAGVALFDMPNSNRFDILSISIFSEISLSISLSIFF